MKSKSRKSIQPRPRRTATQLPRFVRPGPAFVFVACLGIWLPRCYTATLVDLDATQLPIGPLNTWTNAGSLQGNFTVPTGATVPSVIATNGVKGVAFLATGGGAGGTQYIGPIAPAEVTSGNPRTIDAWVYDGAPQGEKTVFAWGRRGGTPDGSNFSFGHGTDPGFGANALWGGPDIGWNEKIAFNRWTHIAYTWDGTTSSVYMDGELANSEVTNPPVDTWEVDNTATANPLPFRVARQNTAAGAISGAGVGEITIAKIRVQDAALDAAAVKAQFNQEKAQFWTDSDGDGMPDWWENQYAPTLDPNVADGAQDPDGDGLTNLQEFQSIFPNSRGASIRPNPTVADTDGDGVSDGAEVNRTAGGNPAPTNPLATDTDGDGLSDKVETGTGTFVGPNDTGTDPLKVDTDGDTFPDLQEILSGSNPNSSASTPGESRPALVNLDATALPLGPLNNWTNSGTLGGVFTNSPVVASVQTVQGVKGVTLNGTDHFYTGSGAPAFITGNASRTVEAWIMNPQAADEETIFSWGRRGGPDGSNTSFNHGLNAAFGAVGHWGAPDLAWGPDAASITNNVKQAQWTYVVYVYDAASGNATVYSNGALANTDAAGPLNTWAVDTLGRPIPFRVGSQNEANGDATPGLRGSMTIGEIRVFDRVLEAATIQSNYTAGADKYGSVDYDNDGLPTWYERQYSFLNERDAADAAQDQDSDGLTNLQEFMLGTNPGNADTDGDGVNDGAEVNRAAGATNPLNPDTDQDGLGDGVETGTGVFVSANNTGTNPLVADTDGDTFADGLEVLYASNPNNVNSVPNFSAPLVNLDATVLPVGPLATLSNTGTLGGTFDAPTNAIPNIEVVGGISGITFDGVNHYYTGPAMPLFLAGNASHTVDAWIFNPAAADEETVFAWGRRGGPDGSNVSFNHGLNAAFGAVGHWAAPDIGWGADATAIAENVKQGQWTYIAYTWDSANLTTTVYSDGALANSEVLTTPLNTWAVDGQNRPLPFRLASQTDAGGNATAGLRGSMTIAKVRVYGIALGAAEIASNYTDGLGAFSRPNIQTISFNPQTGVVALGWTALPGKTYAVEASGSLTNWSAVATGLSTNNFTETPGAGAGSNRFYRIRVE
jgi:hypothetical protein